MRNVLITGAGRGMGLALVKAHLADGDHVFAGYRSESDDLNALACANLTLFHIDIGDPQSVSEAGTFIRSKTDRLDIIYQNAAVTTSDANDDFETLDLETILDVVNINSVGFLRLSQQVWSLIGEGSVMCCVSSTGGSLRRRLERPLSPDVMQIPFSYAMSKAGMNMGGILLEKRLKLKGASLFLVQPGFMRSNMGGPDADIDPAEGAAGVKALATGETPVTSIFVNYLGEDMPL